MRGVENAPFYPGELGPLATARSRAGMEVVAMHFGQPTEGAAPSALAADRQALSPPSFGYWESERLKERFAQHSEEQYGVEVKPGRVLLAAGASAAPVVVPAAHMEGFETVSRPLVRARAHENGLFVAYANCCGHAQDIAYGGCSAVATPDAS